jgi:hypothetical protein
MSGMLVLLTLSKDFSFVVPISQPKRPLGNVKQDAA